MRPSSVILTTLCIGLWFGVAPFAVTYGDPHHHRPLWEGFALVYGIPAGALVFVGVLLALDTWWERRRGK